MSAERRAILDFIERSEGWIALESSSHLPEKSSAGCICGFCVWSPEHVAVMAFRDGARAALAHTAPTTRTPEESSDE